MITQSVIRASRKLQKSLNSLSLLLFLIWRNWQLTISFDRSNLPIYSRSSVWPEPTSFFHVIAIIWPQCMEGTPSCCCILAISDAKSGRKHPHALIGLTREGGREEAHARAPKREDGKNEQREARACLMKKFAAIIRPEVMLYCQKREEERGGRPKSKMEITQGLKKCWWTHEKLEQEVGDQMAKYLRQEEGQLSGCSPFLHVLLP